MPASTNAMSVMYLLNTERALETDVAPQCGASYGRESAVVSLNCVSGVAAHSHTSLITTINGKSIN